jgi:hypothetical protein
MANELEEYTAEEQRFVVRFLSSKGLNGKYIHREVLPVYGGKCLSRNAVQDWVEKFSQGHSKVRDGAGPGAEVAEPTVKRLQCCGF